MRDPNRIYNIANDLICLWMKYPDLRLGQLISNAMDGCGSSLFYIEDDELIERIKKYLGGIKYV